MLNRKNKYKVIFVYFLIFIILFSCYLVKLRYFGPYVYCMDFTEEMERGLIERSPLPKLLEESVNPYTYSTTGGLVDVSKQGVIESIRPKGWPLIGHDKPEFWKGYEFHRNFASILYEIRHAGQNNVDFSALEYTLKKELYPGIEEFIPEKTTLKYIIL